MGEGVLITGGCGFVGSNLAIFLKKDFPDARIIALDNLRRRGSEINISRLKEFGVEFIHGDIRNKTDFNEIGEISCLIEAAAEPSVLSGIDSSPDYVIDTNLNGTINCLAFAARYKASFIFLSTSRVYPIKALNEIQYVETEHRLDLSNKQMLTGVSGKGINEDFPLAGPRSFYGASKLASELLIQEYSEFYGIPSVINRCGIITGPWQMGKVDQGVVVLWVAKHFWKKELSYIGFNGTGKQVRDILHIEDLYQLLKYQIQNMTLYNKGIYNVGGGLDVSVSLKELTVLCEEVTGNKIKINRTVQNRDADIPIYISDNSLITNISNWKSKTRPDQIVNDIFNWLKSNEKLVEPILS
jgi:CDP-paratose 2-epimerase